VQSATIFTGKIIIYLLSIFIFRCEEDFMGISADIPDEVSKERLAERGIKDPKSNNNKGFWNNILQPFSS